MPLLHRIIETTLDLSLNRKAQERLGRFILNRARGENNDDAESNGEYALLDRLSCQTNNNAVLFDVGANKGEWIMRAYPKFGLQSSFFAFEPVAATHSFLQTKLAALSNTRIKTVHLALGDTNGSIEMNVSGVLAGSNSLHQRTGVKVKHDQVELVTVQRGTDFCRTHMIDRITLLKIDTEGHEMAVLLGFADMLAIKAIDLIQFEYGGTWIDARTLLKDAFSLFNENGYRVGRLMRDHVEWQPDYRQEFENFSYSNWIASLPEVHC